MIGKEIGNFINDMTWNCNFMNESNRYNNVFLCMKGNTSPLKYKKNIFRDLAWIKITCHVPREISSFMLLGSKILRVTNYSPKHKVQRNKIRPNLPFRCVRIRPQGLPVHRLRPWWISCAVSTWNELYGSSSRKITIIGSRMSYNIMSLTSDRSL